jgi:zinc transport system ATP-binding protein
MNDQPAAIVFDNVSVTMDGVRILESVNATVPKASTTAIIGPNGAGKTTLLLALLGQIPHGGTIRLLDGGRKRGQDPFVRSTLRAYRQKGPDPFSPPRIGYVPQHLDFDRGTPVTVMESMVMGLQRMPLWFGTARSFRQKARAVLAEVRVDHLADRQLGVLSGGELQRVLLALAIVQDPDILILDEPASGVDVAGEDLLCELLENLHRRHGFTQVMVNHDMSNVLAHASHVICLNRRVIASGPVATTLTDETLARTFGIHLGLVDVSTCRIDPHKKSRDV